MLFTLDDVHFTYLKDTPFEAPALRGMTLNIPQQGVTALVGPSQSGKSTLLDVLAGLIRPQSGSFRFQDQDLMVRGSSLEGLREVASIVFQEPDNQIFEETVGLDVSFVPRRKKLPLERSRALVRNSLEAVGLDYEDFRSRYTYALSGGEKRRVALAGALAKEPEILLLDEPMAGLDPQGREDVRQIVRMLAHEQAFTVLYATSNLEQVIDLADTIHILHEGRLFASGTPEELLLQSDTLAAIGIELPEATTLAVTLRELYPQLPATITTLDALEQALLPLLPGKNLAETSYD